MPRTLLPSYITALTLLATALVGCGGSNPNSASSSSAATEKDQIAFYQAETQEKMKSIIKDPDSAKYKNVHAYRLSVQGQTVYNFCGQVNSKNGFGGYSCYQRFIGSPAMVGLEEQISQLGTAWNQLCNPANDTGEVAF